MTNTSNSLSFTQDMALVQMFGKEEVFTTALPMMWKEKITNSKTPTPGKGENRAAKRKLYSPGSNSEDEDKKGTPKRRRDSLVGELSPTGLSKPKTPVASARLTVPLSERQQMALLMQMTADKSNQPTDAVLHYPATPTSPHSVQKRTPSDRKVNKRNERGETPLHLAAIRGDVKATKKLIKSGVDVNIEDYAGWTPLHEACNHGWIEIARQLLKAGANVNAQGLDNDLPLHDAAINGHSKLVELLLRHGADPLRQNRKGKSPMDMAANKEIVRLMKSEVVASSSSSSSIADVRSPTSPESNNSEREDMEQPHKLIDSVSELGLLTVKQRSSPLPIRRWDSEVEHSTNNQWNNANVLRGGTTGGVAPPATCPSSQSRIDPHSQISPGLSPTQLMSSSLSQTVCGASSTSSAGLHSTPLSTAAGVSKKVHVSHYMDRSSSSPRLTLKFRHIKQKDSGNKLLITKNVSEDMKVSTGSSCCSYKVSVSAVERPLASPIEAEQLDERPENPGTGRSTPISGTNVPDPRTLWIRGINANLREGIENAGQNKASEIILGKSSDDVSSDMKASFSNQFEDISDAEDDRPSKPLDIGSAAKMFSLSQLSQHIPSVSAVYQCHPSSNAIFYDGNGPTPMSSLPLLSGLNWSNINYGNYAGVGGGMGGPTGNQFSLPLATERTQARPGTSENSVFPWGQGNVSVKPMPSVKAMAPLSIDTNVVAQPQTCMSGEKPDSKVCASDLLISLPPSSSCGSAPKPGDKTDNCLEDQKLFIKNEVPLGDGQQLGVQQSGIASDFCHSEKMDVEQKTVISNCDLLALKTRTSPTEASKSEMIAENKFSILDKSSSVKPEAMDTCSSENPSQKQGNDSNETDSMRRTGLETDNVAASNLALNDPHCDGLRIDTEEKPDTTRSTPDPNKIPLSCGQELLENSNLSSSENSSSVLRVPPLKIIIPSKNGAVVDKDALSTKMASSKSNLPYIVNALQDSTVEPSSFDSISIDVLAAKDANVCSLPESVLIENCVMLESLSGDQKDPLISRKRKFKTSCKGLTREKDKDLESVNAETISNGDSKEFSVAKGSCSSKDSNDLKLEEKIEMKENKQLANQPSISGMERRMTRSAVRSQQQRGQQKEKYTALAMEVTPGPAKNESGSHHPGTEKENRDGHVEIAATGKNNGDVVEEEAVYCPRKHKAKHRQLQQEQTTVESHVPIAPPQTFKKPTNPYDVYMEFKKKVAERKSRLSTVVPKLPASYSNFMMVQCHYTLHRDKTKQDDLKLSLPNDLPEALKDLFEEQEQRRHQFRMQHMKERERLVILTEQEMLRVQGRAARAMAGQGDALSVSTLLCAEEAHCRLEFDQDDKDQRSRYNGRQLKSWMDEVQEKFTTMKTQLLSRHHLEADILHSVQKLDWEWKMKEVGFCDHHSTPTIDELHVPIVTVSDNLDLPGT